MKHTLLYLSLLFLSINNLFAQEPITVSGNCFIPEALGIYIADGESNGKPRYFLGDTSACSAFSDQSPCEAADVEVYDISWTGTEWRWRVLVFGCQWFSFSSSCTILSSGQILATNTADTPFPPCLGWEEAPSGCIPELSSSGCSALSILENTFSGNLMLYPNPTKDNVTIDFGKLNKELSISLSNISGQTIWTKKHKNASSIKFEIKQPAGIYFLEITGEKGENAHLKLIKE